MESYGDATLDLIERVWSRDVRHSVVLMRHAAREFDPELHDLQNPLTAEGRARAREVGGRLPRGATLRGYASPPERCMETAALILEGYRDAGGRVTRHRPLEALGVFYALDQMKMWKAMHAMGGLVPFVTAWIRGEAPADAMIPADQAARLILNVLAEKLERPVDERQLDLCVSHDMTLYLLREVLLDEPAAGPEVAFLDALVLFREDGALWMSSHHGEPRRVG
ncbi:MAG TPA: histidine phosphatase family protein [Pseudomonadales bacterium]